MVYAGMIVDAALCSKMSSIVEMFPNGICWYNCRSWQCVCIARFCPLSRDSYMFSRDNAIHK